MIAGQYFDLFNDYAYFGGTVDNSKDWYWVSTGNSVEYNMSWFPGQPDNYNSIEYCLSLKYHSDLRSAKLNDVPCSSQMYQFTFICEKNSSKPYI